MGLPEGETEKKNETTIGPFFVVSIIIYSTSIMKPHTQQQQTQ